MASGKSWSQEQRAVLFKLYGTVPVALLADQLNSTVQSLRTLACRFGLTKPRKYTVNKEFFDVVDTYEKAYWLGFLFADGSIGRSPKTGTPANVRLEIDKRDAAHVTAFIKAVGSDVPLNYRPNRNTATAIICDPHLATRVAQLIRPKETATPWVELTANLRTAFIRGVFDGDGCITHCGPAPRIEFLGNAAFCSLVEAMAPIKFSRREYHCKNGWLFNLYTTGITKLRDFAVWLYGDDGPCLQRKLWKFGSLGVVPFIAGGALPNSINKDVPAGSDLPSTIDNRIRNLALAVEDILGIPDQTSISNAGFLFTSDGLSSIAFQNTARTPSTNGHLQRNAAELQYYDGTSSYNLVLDTRTGTLSNKTLTSTTLNSPTLNSATLNGLRGPITGVLEYASTHTLALNVPWRITASVATNALTVALKNVDGNDATASSTIPFVFRSATTTEGSATIRLVNSALSITAPSGAELGLSANAFGRIWAGVVDTGSTVALFLRNNVDSASSNLSLKLPSPLTLSTTAIGTGSDSAAVAYANGAWSNRPWQWVGYVDTQAGTSAGVWSNTPLAVHTQQLADYRPGQILQNVVYEDTAQASTTATIPGDNTSPEITEGARFMRQDFTGLARPNLLDVDVVVYAAHSTNVDHVIALFEDQSTFAVAASAADHEGGGGANTDGNHALAYRRVIGTAGSAFTYDVRAGLASAGTFYFNFNSWFAGKARSRIAFKETMV